MDANAIVVLGGGSPGPPKTREQVCSINLTFQGLTVQTAQYGSLNWFEVALDQLDAADRQSVYSAKHAAGDTHLALAVSHAYLEAGVPSPQCNGKDWTNNLSGFVNLISEVLANGFVPMVFLAGDGMSANDDPQFGEYNDPVGWTYGYQWLMNNLERIVDALNPVGPNCLFVPGFDGVFYGWSIPHEVPDLQPLRVREFGAHFRTLRPTWHLGLEHTPGDLPVGGGPIDYAPGGAMATYDVLLTEFSYPPSNDTVWQPAARLLGPAYVRPPDQPSGDDPPPAPFYLADGTSRGPYFTCAFEWEGLYYWVRGEQTEAEIVQQRAYLRGCGYTCLG